MTRERPAAAEGRYERRRLLGEGGMASVYEAYDRMLDRVVALKQLHPALAADDRARERFVHEAQVAAGLAHPNVARIYDVGEDQLGPYLVQELVEGRPLDQALPLPAAQAVAVAAQLAAALDVIHQHGVIHCDVKPQNVILTPDGQPVLLDFGIAEAPGTVSEQLLGTPHYLAPERAEGGLPAPAADVYALGVLLYELLTGRLPIDGQTPLSILQAHLNEGVPPLRQAAPGLAPTLEPLLARMTARDPAQRPSMAGLAAELSALLEISQRSTSVMQAVPRRLTVPLSNAPTEAIAPLAADQHQPARRPLPSGLRRLTGVLAGTQGSAPAWQSRVRELLALIGAWVLQLASQLRDRAGPVLRRGAARLARPGLPAPSSQADRRTQYAALAALVLVVLGVLLVRARNGDVALSGAGVAELSWPVVLEDSFDEQRWPLLRRNNLALAYVDGRYQLSMQPGVNTLWSYSREALPGGDVAISVDIEPRQGRGGILFGFNNGEQHYRLLTGPDGSYSLERRLNGAVERLAEGTGAGAGRLSLVLNGTRARIYHDSQLLGEARLPEPPQGRYGFVLVDAGAAEAFFDNFSLRRGP